ARSDRGSAQRRRDPADRRRRRRRRRRPSVTEGGTARARGGERGGRREGAAGKVSAGAVSRVKIAEVVNIARALEILKDAGVWTVGLAGDAPQTYDAGDLTGPAAIAR